MYSIQQLTEAVLSLGVKENDTLVAHTALRSVGTIAGEEGSPATRLISALRAAVPCGVLIIPAFTYASVREDHIFDVRNTQPCIGGVPCAAVELANAAYDRGDKTVLRSLNPSHSVVAFGENAYEYVKNDQRSETPFPAFGSYGKMMTAGGKILFVGAPLSTNSFIHAIDEDLEPWGVHSSIDVTVIDYEGHAHPRRSAQCRGPSSKYPLYEPYLREAGALTYGKIGDADAILCDALLCNRVVRETRDIILGRR